MADPIPTRKYERKNYVHCEHCGELVPRKLLRQGGDEIFGDRCVECPAGHPIDPKELGAGA